VKTTIPNKSPGRLTGSGSRLTGLMLFVVVFFAGTALAAIQLRLKLIAGSGITVTPVDNTTSGQQEWTVSATGASCPINLATCVTGILASPNGGTGVASPTAHSLMVAEGASPVVALGPVARLSSPVLSNGASADPFFAAYTIGNPGASGKLMQSDGTNWVNTTFTLANPGTSGGQLTSDGTNWLSLLFGSAFNSNGGVSVPNTSAITQIGSIAVTAPTGGAKANINISFNLLEVCGACSNSADVTYGVGVDSNASYVDSHSISFPPAVPSTHANFVAPPEAWQASLAAGSHTIYALSSSASLAVTAAANTQVVLTP
jgi:hypothetical protein